MKTFLKDPGAWTHPEDRVVLDLVYGWGNTGFSCCRLAMQPDARLLLIESVVGPPNEDPQSNEKKGEKGTGYIPLVQSNKINDLQSEK